MEDRDASPKTAHTLEAVMRAIAADYARRPDLSRLFAVARRRQTPRLRKWLAEMIPVAEADMRRSEQDATRHRRDACVVTAAWWQAARWCVAQPSPLLALVLAPTRESLAHRADYLPHWAEIHDESAAFYRRRLDHWRTEAEGLRRPQRRRTATVPAPARLRTEGDRARSAHGAPRAGAPHDPRPIPPIPTEVPVSLSPTPLSERAARAALAAFYRPHEVAAGLAGVGAAALWQRLTAPDPRSRLAAYRPEAELSKARLTAEFVIPGDDMWPTALDTLGDACPLGLWVRGTGNLAELSARAVAVTGRRNASESGNATAGQLARDLTDAGHAVATALSYGIANAAQRAVHAEPAPVLAVLPCGLDRCHPYNQTELLHRVVHRGGVAVSAYRPGTPTSADTLAATGRLLAALTRAVVLVEPEPDPSTVPLEAARAAYSMGRAVFLLNSGDADSGAGYPRRAARLLASVRACRVEGSADVVNALTGHGRPHCDAPEQAGGTGGSHHP
ncbi:DNA-processing protein DprA [Streptomyces sp. NPDC020681]|uniref:DNA-processing protein DprA n=1 Tax=Streptomyces sp. NPDC020681 TaxID=3365083 RepID=UPI00379DCBB0